MLEFVLIVGLFLVGIEVYKFGVLVIFGVFYFVCIEKVSVGVMILVSYNLVFDNGIKFFGSDGFKFDDDCELEIEVLFDVKEDILLCLLV